MGRWMWCDVIDEFEMETVPEPEWDKVPEFKREIVRARYQAARLEKLKPIRCKMWEPQIPWYQRQPQYQITVLEPA